MFNVGEQNHPDLMLTLLETIFYHLLQLKLKMKLMDYVYFTGGVLYILGFLLL